MKIALFHNLPSGGAKRHTYEQVRELAKRGYEVEEFTTQAANLSYCSLAPYTKQQHVFDAPGSHLTRRRLPLITPYVHALQGIHLLQRTEGVNRTIAGEIDRLGFDLVFVKDCRIVLNPYVLCYLRTPSLFQCHHGLRNRTELKLAEADSEALSHLDKIKQFYYHPPRALVQRKLWSDEARNARHATRVLTNSSFSAQLIQDSYGIASHVVYPGINTNVFRPLDLDESDYVLTVGALLHSKGHRFLIDAIAHLDASLRPPLFIAANSRDQNEELAVRRMASEFGVDLHIEQITDDERLVQVYNRARVFVYAPLQEPLGMAPLEALACGTPVVAVGEGGVTETVVDGLTGWLIERDVIPFSSALAALLSDQAARAKMGRAGVSHVREQWTWERAVDALEAHLQEVAATRPMNSTSYCEDERVQPFSLS